MNSRNLVLIAFAGWSILCSWWYVCHIKQACGPRPAIAAETDVPVALESEPVDSVSITSTTEPTETSRPEPVRPQESSAKSAPSESVQVIETGENAEIHFPYNSTQKEESEAIDEYLSRLADQLAQSGRRVSIEGHTDGIGDPKSNFGIAERRAKNIRDILVKKGVKPGQIIVRSHGELRPRASNDTPEGRYQNRRVEIKFVRR